MALELIRKTKTVLLEILGPKSLTYKIYAELAIWNLILKFEPQTIQGLSNFWRCNHTKIMHQIIVINFSKFLSNYRIFWRQDAHLFCFIYHFFSICLLIWFFFSWFSNTSNCIDPDFHNFSSTYLKFITKNGQHRIWKIE